MITPEEFLKLYSKISKRVNNISSILGATAQVHIDDFLNSDLSKVRHENSFLFYCYAQQLLKLVVTPICEAQRQAALRLVCTVLNYLEDPTITFPRFKSLETIMASCNTRLNQKNYYLMRAAEQDDLDLAKACLAQSADVNFRFVGDYPVIVALKNNSEQVISLLLATPGIDVNCVCDFRSALMWAVAKGNQAVAKRLIDLGAEINFFMPGSKGATETALTLAICGGDEQMLDLVLSVPNIQVNQFESSDLESCQYHTDKASYHAIKSNNRSALKKLFDHELVYQPWMLELAQSYEHTEIISLLQARAEIDQAMGEPLCCMFRS